MDAEREKLVKEMEIAERNCNEVARACAYDERHRVYDYACCIRYEARRALREYDAGM